MPIDADYQPHMDENLNDNPLTEAIQIELSQSALLERLTVHADIMTNFWDLPVIYQMTQLRQLTDIHIPAAQTWGLYVKVMSLILFGYVRRNPFSAQMRKMGDRVASAMRHGRQFNPSDVSGITTAPTALVIGESGTGKTTIIRRVLQQIPQAIQHQRYNAKHLTKKQLVWISFDLPPNGSPKAMVNSFLRAVDTALENDYDDSYAKKWTDDNGKHSVDKLMAVMQNITMHHSIGLVHIDELQFMLGYNKIKDSPSLQILEALFNKIGIPILLSSTRQGVELFDTLKAGDERLGHDMTTVRRMLNDREFQLKTHLPDSAYYSKFFDALFPPGLVIEGQQTEHQAFKKTFHHLSCGLPAIMTRLAHQHHETLLTMRQQASKQEKYHCTYDVKLLNTVFKTQFHLIEPALIALRAGNTARYEQKLRDNKDKIAVYSNAEKKAVDEADKAQLPPTMKVLKSADAPTEGLGLLIPKFIDDDKFSNER